MGHLTGAFGATIGRFECGERTPCIDLTKSLAEIFGFELDALVSRHKHNTLSQDSLMLELIRATGDLLADERNNLWGLEPCGVIRARLAHAAT